MSAHTRATPKDVARFVAMARTYADLGRGVLRFLRKARKEPAWWSLSRAQREAVVATSFRTWYGT